MIINLSPSCTEGPAMELSVVGDTLTINGEVFDFGPMPIGYHMETTAVESPWFTGPPIIKDSNGELTVTLLFPYAYGAGEDMQYPEPIHVTEDGPVLLPTYVAPEPPELPDVLEIEPEQEDEITGLLPSPTDPDAS